MKALKGALACIAACLALIQAGNPLLCVYWLGVTMYWIINAMT